MTKVNESDMLVQEGALVDFPSPCHPPPGLVVAQAFDCFISTILLHVAGKYDLRIHQCPRVVAAGYDIGSGRSRDLCHLNTERLARDVNIG